MAKMGNLSFDDGYKSFTVNGDPDRVIRFNPADPEIINRLLALKKKFENYQPPEGLELNLDGTPKNDMEREGAYVAEFSEAMRQAFNDTFNSDIYDIIFDGQSPLCMPGGEYLFITVLGTLIELMEPEMKAYREKNQKRMKKYLGDVK